MPRQLPDRIYGWNKYCPFMQCVCVTYACSNKVMEANDWQNHDWQQREKNKRPSDWQYESGVDVKCGSNAEQQPQIRDEVGRARRHTWPSSEEQVSCTEQQRLSDSNIPECPLVVYAATAVLCLCLLLCCSVITVKYETRKRKPQRSLLLNTANI